MQENEFEKKLKTMMEDFNLSPSDAVWQKVKQKIQKKNRRKIPFFFLLGIGLLTAGYFIVKLANYKSAYINKAEKNISKNINNSKQKITTKATESNSSNLKTELSSFNKDSDKNKNNSSIRINKNVFVVDENNIKSKRGLITNSNRPVLFSNQENKNNISVSKQTVLQKDSVLNQQQTAINQVSKSEVQNAVTENNKNFLKDDSAAASLTNQKNIFVKSSVKKQNKIYKTPNWQWGVTAFYGRSNLVEAITNFNKSAVQYGNPASVNLDTATKTVHPFTSSNAYSFGVTLQKKISKNAFISSGLNFIHLAAKSNIGKTNDPVNPGFFTSGYYLRSYTQPGSLNTYNSRYNFIELPVYFQQNFFHANKISLSYDAGFSIRQLLSSNSIFYNQTLNSYFLKNDLLRKTQLQAQAALNFTINTGKNSSVYIGPRIFIQSYRFNSK